jgi:hypothetical protein
MSQVSGVIRRDAAGVHQHRLAALEWHHSLLCRVKQPQWHIRSIRSIAVPRLTDQKPDLRLEYR